MKIVATISIAEMSTSNHGQTSYKKIYTSRVFDGRRSLDDVVQWAFNMTGKITTISEIQFSDSTGEST
jgi:hypothetical protein